MTAFVSMNEFLADLTEAEGRELDRYGVVGPPATSLYALSRTERALYVTGEWLGYDPPKKPHRAADGRFRAKVTE